MLSTKKVEETNITGKEFLIETKVYSSPKRFETGKKQLAYYCKSLNLKTGVYLVFIPQRARLPETVKEQIEVIEDVEVSAWLVFFDEGKW